MFPKTPPKSDPERESADELLCERIVEEAGRAVREAIRDHKRTGHSIAVWQDERVVIIPPEQIED